MDFLNSSDFNYDIIDDVIVIYDQDQGGRSVTNDVHQVLALIKEDLGNQFAGKKIIYRDSMKIFDRIGIDANGRFTRFYPLQETVLENALNKLRKDQLQ